MPSPAALRVLELSRFPRSTAGSFIPMVVAVCEEAKRRGHEPAAVFFEESREAGWVGEFADREIPLHFAPPGTRRELTEWLRAVPLGGAGEEEVAMHTHFTAWDLPAVRAARGVERASVHWHVHSTLPLDPVTTARTAVKFGVLGRSVSSYLCPAENIARSVRHRGAPRGRVRIVPSAIDTSQFPLIEPAERLEARSDLGLPPDARVLIHFGWHWKIKGTDRFIDAVAAIREERDVIAVSNRGGDKASARAAELGISDSVSVIEGIDDVRTLFAAADLLVASSRREGMPFAVLEALSSGVPVVATDIPGHAVVGREVAACKLVGHDPGEIAKAAAELLDRDPGVAASEAAESRAWIERNLGLDAYGVKMVDQLEGRDPFRWEP